jgi:hypothetical protein
VGAEEKEELEWYGIFSGDDPNEFDLEPVEACFILQRKEALSR